MENYCIYRHSNKLNGKIYIGQTCQFPEKRWGVNGINYKDSPYFWNAIQKYGWDKFEHTILEINLTQEEANEKEKYWIAYYDSTNRDKGYNISLGGVGSSFDQDRENRNLPQSRDNCKNSKPIICLEDGVVYPSMMSAYRALGGVGDDCAGLRKKLNHPERCVNLAYKGKHFIWYTDDLKEKTIYELHSLIPKNNEPSTKKGNYKKIKNLNTDEIFNSIKEAGEKYNFNPASLSKKFSKHKKKGHNIVSFSGYLWEKM